MTENAALEKPLEARKSDGMLRVSQDNAQRALVIEEINAVALARLGYAEEEVKGRKLEVLLGHESALVIDEDLEYEDAAPDFADIFAKHRSLRLRLRSGQEITALCRVHRLLAGNAQAQFQLILPSDREDQAQQNLREFLRVNLEGHQQLDPVTGLPDRATMEAAIDRMRHFSGETGTEVCVAIIRLDRWEKSVARYGRAQSQELLKHVASCCRSTFRSEDIVGSIGDHVALLLVNLSRESARVVLNRLRWNIGSRMMDFGGKSNFSITISLEFNMLSAENAASILRDCEVAVNAIDESARNAFIELEQ